MSKVINLTGLSLAISKLKAWVNSVIDWNANEGQDGYIKNRTHYANIFNGKITDEGILYDLGDIVNIENGCVIELVYDGYYKSFKPGVEESWTTDWAGITNIVVSYNGYASIYITEEYGDDSYYEDMLDSIVCYTPTKQLNEIYIPNTVLKTTPQELSNTDKNQALTNLGIDPVVWKYMCNPINVTSGDATIPDELIFYDGDSDEYQLKYPIAAMYTSNGILPIGINASTLTFKRADDSQFNIYVAKGHWEI